MELRQLKSFIAVAETSSFKHAGERCNLTTGAISQQIKQLEEEFNTELFVRGSHGVSLTDTGVQLLSRARRVIKEADDCIEHMKSLEGGLTGTLSIGVGSFIIPYIRKAGLMFKEKYPNVILNVKFYQADILNRLLQERKIDLAFTSNRAYFNENINSTPCIPYYLRAIMPKHHPLACKDVVTYQDLLKYYVALPDAADRVFKSITDYMEEDVDLSKMKICLIANSPDELLVAAEELNCITFLPALNIKGFPNLVAKPIKGLEKPIASNVHWIQDACVKRTAQEFYRLIRDFCVPYFETVNV